MKSNRLVQGPDDPRSGDTQAAQFDMIRRALSAGVHPRVEIGNQESTQPWLDLGVRHFCVGRNISVLCAWGKDQGNVLQEPGQGTMRGGCKLGC